MYKSVETLRDELRLARYTPLHLCPTRFLLPTIKLAERKTHEPWKEASVPAVVVKADELLTPNGTNTNVRFQQLSAAGGLKNYLGFDGNIILSSIMPDKKIFGLKSESYSKLIQILKPNYYITPDGETYLGEENQSEEEIARILEQTKYLIKSCPNSIPLGLVKGCTIGQVRKHVIALSNLGISQFVFHVGDYVCRGSKYSSNMARVFARQIRKEVPWLMVYGVGSNHHFRQFSDADGFVTQTHFINAFYGKQLVDGIWQRIRGEVTRNIIMKNLYGIESDLLQFNSGGLRQWTEHEEVIMTTTGKNAYGLRRLQMSQ